MEGIQLLLTPFVWILMLFYRLAQNYGVALLLFAVVVKLILFPFQLKGKRSMIQMTLISDKMQKLQKQYGKDKERYNEEVQRLYEKENINPMSGCLWSFLPLLILLPLYAIIRQPLTYLMNLTVDQVVQVAGALDWSQIAVSNGWIREAAEYSNAGYNQLYLASLITPENVAGIAASLGEAGKNLFAVNFQFFGLDLSQIPQLKFWTNGISWGAVGLFLLPFISAASGFVFSLISMKTNAVNQQSEAAANTTNRSMLIISPLMSLWIGFAMPAALCVYWIVQNLLSMLQEFICGKMLKKDYEAAALRRAEQARLEKEEEKERRRQAAEERARQAEEAKRSKGKKKVSLTKEKDEEKSSGEVQEASRVGMRTYARGRAYDPRRYGIDPTPYRDPGVSAEKKPAEKDGGKSK
ncbi:MAG: membrane protein insertase YidC [Oscillospiraceae bacterium]|nr:membrane protein insertase YidC [Oscillospiraceae bacterium]